MLQKGARKGLYGIGVVAYIIVCLLGGTVGAKGEMLEARVSNSAPVLLELCRVAAVSGSKRQTSRKSQFKLIVPLLDSLRSRINRGNCLDSVLVIRFMLAATCVGCYVYHGESDLVWASCHRQQSRLRK
jgi:hypothetical protein